MTMTIPFKPRCPNCKQRHLPEQKCPEPKAEERLDERVEQLGAPKPRLRDDLPPAA